MKSWQDYKNHVKAIDENGKTLIEETEEIAGIISSLIDRRNELVLSQRQLAAECGMPQSSLARIESMKITPNLDTLIRIMRPLNLKISVVKLQ